MAPRGAPIPDDHMKEAVGLPQHPSTTVATFPSFTLANGHILTDVVVAYSTYGTLNPVRHFFLSFFVFTAVTIGFLIPHTSSSPFPHQPPCPPGPTTPPVAHVFPFPRFSSLKRRLGITR